MTKKELTNVGYEFVEGRHCHYLDGKKLTGVTTILGIISKPALVQWAANMAVDYIKNNSAGGGLLDYLVTNEILEQARKAHRIKKEEAGQKGTDTHAEIEKIVKDAIETNLGYVKAENVLNENKQISHFAYWSTQNKVKFLESEAKIYSKELFVGGICDFVCEIDGETWLGDIKTGNGIYADAFFQMAGYHILIEDMKLYSDIKGYIVLNLRKNGEFEEKRSISNNDNRDAFLSALKLYRIKEKVEGQIL